MWLIPHLTCMRFSTHKSINVIKYISKIKDKNYVILSVDTKEECAKIQNPFMIKSF